MSSIRNVGLTILRIGAGLMIAFGHGLGKFPPSERFIETVGNLGFPFPVLFAWAATATELLGGLLLAIGLFVRPAAFFVFVMMFVAAVLRHADDPFSTKEKAILYGLIALAFLFFGGGQFSLDEFLKRRSSRKRS